MRGLGSVRLWPLILSAAMLAGMTVFRHPPVVELAASVSVPRPFVVFDATLYKNKPDLTDYGVRPITVWYESKLFVANQSPIAMPPEPLLHSLAYDLRGSVTPLVIDIERWPITGDPATVQSTVEKFKAVLTRVRSAAPDLLIGVYGTVPVYDYWRAIFHPTSVEFRSWQTDNDRLEKICDYVDALFPSIYTFYPDQEAWDVYARAQISEARRKAQGKPVYAFLWPQYHEANAALANRPVEPDYWELQLRTMRLYADGVVIWGGWGENGPEPWNEAAPWWQVTKRFLSQLKSTGPAPPTDITVE